MRISDKNCIGIRITCYYSCDSFHLFALLINSATSIKYLELASVLYWFLSIKEFRRIQMNLVLILKKEALYLKIRIFAIVFEKPII